MPNTAAEVRPANGRDVAGTATRTTVLVPGSRVFTCSWPSVIASEGLSVAASHDASASRPLSGVGSSHRVTDPEEYAPSVGFEIVTAMPSGAPGPTTPP